MFYCDAVKLWLQCSSVVGAILVAVVMWLDVVMCSSSRAVRLATSCSGVQCAAGQRLAFRKLVMCKYGSSNCCDCSVLMLQCLRQYAGMIWESGC